jgi:osmotically-inducible protein OsmY
LGFGFDFIKVSYEKTQIFSSHARTVTGCSDPSTKSPDIATRIRKSLDQAGLKLKGVAVDQDRDKGIMTLGGHVASDNDKSHAESLAKSLVGAQVVANWIAMVRSGVEKEAQA